MAGGLPEPPGFASPGAGNTYEVPWRRAQGCMAAGELRSFQHGPCLEERLGARSSSSG